MMGLVPGRPRTAFAGVVFCLVAVVSGISGRAEDTPKTFGSDVWPIVRARCAGCHQRGAIAPMALTSYRETRPWARAIRQAVLTRAMPPWHAVESGEHLFRNDRSLAAAEIDTVVKWVDDGSPEGPAIEPFVPDQTAKSWKLGTPDRVIQIPGFAVPEKGPVPYSFLIVPLHFDHDTWIRAAEFRIDQRALIHHINAFVRGPGSSFLSGFPSDQIFVPTLAQRGKKNAGERLFDRRQLLLGYEPGYEPMAWLDDGGKLIKAGSDLVFEMHFNPNGRAATDHSELALYFASSAPKNRVLAIDTLRDLDLAIPPGSADYLSRASATLARSCRLLSIQPHMHVRGKSMKVSASYPDGHSAVLLDVPKYDFGWQTTYVLKDPLLLPSGTRLESVAGFDNSPNNRFNPDAAATVHWGDQTTEEMHIAFLELIIDARSDPETLFTAPPKMIGERTSIQPH